MNNNYYILFENQIKEITEKGLRPSLLLHACCAPCSSHCITVLAKYFDITMYFYNPNMDTEEEYDKRFDELQRFIAEAGFSDKVKAVKAKYDPLEFQKIAEGREDMPERGMRCYDCYKLRMEKAFVYALENSFDYCTTTLSISPHKNSAWINEIGISLEGEGKEVTYLFSDFKKKNGYKHSIELSKEYNLYRQDYCGCRYSKAARERKEEG